MRPVRNAQEYEEVRASLAELLLEAPAFNRGSVHAQAVTDRSMHTKELTYVDFSIMVPSTQTELAEMVSPNLPWAEDHFLERISGEPLNPPPSNEWWPFAQAGNKDHKGEDEKFSHTYPERFWPRSAGFVNNAGVHRGIRYFYGDLGTLVRVMKKNPLTRQAYLPIWFPEDIQAAEEGERVPCTLGYHFMIDSSSRMNLFYPMRSCDFLRFMPDDIYMAGRLLQYVSAQLGLEGVVPGRLKMSISSLHVFEGDRYRLEQMVETPAKEEDDEWDYLSGVQG